MSESAPTLLPCPFPTEKTHNLTIAGVNGPVWVECMECGCRGPMRRSRDDAIAAWNRRRSDVWQPIETAPKDGTRILAYAPNHPDLGHIWRVTWWRTAGPAHSYEGWGEFSADYWPPTHWQPLIIPRTSPDAGQPEPKVQS